MAELPSGTITLVFTDIEGSTRLLERLGNRYAAALEDHRRLLRAAFERWGGREVDTQGDAFFVAFPRAADAVAAAIEAQRSLAAHPWPDGAAIRVRIGLHAGEPTPTRDGYVGLDVHRAARLCAAGHGGQVLLSSAAQGLVDQSLPPGVGLRDLGEHRLKDLQQPEHAFQLVIPELPADFPPLRSTVGFPNNLPRQLTSFVGREREIAAVARLLGAAPLLTLTGAGGAGKTRLALRVASELGEAYADGVWLVELAPLADPALVPRAVAATLGLVEGPQRPLLETLADFLRPRSMLLVLDNCEHLIAACAALAEYLLHVSPGLRILATSREPLGVPGEATWRVPSLSLPDPGRPEPVEQLGCYEAVRLFVERAVAARADFELTERNAAAVAEICRRVDGIPLAIELAAARVKVLPPEQIARRLDDRFRLLTGGGRTAVPRHQTLRALVDWSYELLAEPERLLLRRLSAFAGGWTLDAAEAVCAGDGLEAYEVLDLLAQLVDKSLVLADEQDGEARYRLLETVRQYAQERLLESGEAPAIRARHLAHFLRLAEEVRPKLDGPEQAIWFERLETEHDNLRAALAWSRSDAGSLEAGLRLAALLNWFWTLRGHLREAAEHLAGLLALSSAPTTARAAALVAAGWMSYTRVELPAACSHLEEGLALFRRLRDRRGEAVALAYLGRAADALGDFGRAVSLLEEARRLFEALGGESGLDSPLVRYFADVALHSGDHDRAHRLYEECFAQASARGDQHGIAHAMRGLANLERIRGDGVRAIGLLEDSLAMLRELKDKRCAASCLGELARASTAVVLRPSAEGRVRPEHAARLFGAAEAGREAIGTPLPQAERTGCEQDLAALREQLGEGTFAAAWTHGRGMTLEQAVAYALSDPSEG